MLFAKLMLVNFTYAFWYDWYHILVMPLVLIPVVYNLQTIVLVYTIADKCSRFSNGYQQRMFIYSSNKVDVGNVVYVIVDDVILSIACMYVITG